MEPAALIASPTVSDVPELGAFSNRIFGDYDGVEAQLRKYIESEKFRVRFARSPAGAVVALGVASANRDFAGEKFGSFGPSVAEFLHGQTVGLVHMLAVAPDLRGRGLGKRIGLDLLSALKEAGCTVVAGTSWDNGTEQNSRALFEAGGFTRIAESAIFLNEESRRTGFRCAKCGGECFCTSYFYGLRL